ncbi:MAG: hypothetical protein ACAH95_03025 [Fimbriimonas sp.]
MVALTLSFLLLAQAGADVVTLNAGATRVPALLQQIASLTGKQLKAAPQLEDEVLFLHLNARPVQEILDGIAEVCHAEWETKSDTLWLTKSAKRSNQDRLAESAQLAKEFSAVMEEEFRTHEDIAWTEKDVQSRFDALEKLPARQLPDASESMRHSMPKARLFRRIARSMDLKALLSLPQQESFSFSTSPTRTQRPLPAAAQGALRDFLREQELIMRRVAPPVDPEAIRGQMLDYVAGSYHTQVQEPATALLTFERLSRDALFFVVNVFDRDGYRVGTYSRSFVLKPTEAQPFPYPHMAEWQSERLEPSREMKAAVAAYGSETEPFENYPGVEQPEKLEPIGFFVNSGLAKLASKAKTDVIARVPDNIIFTYYSQAPRVQTLGAFANQVLSKDTRTTVKNNVLLIEPKLSEECYMSRAKRSSLGKLIRSGELPSLEAFAAYAVDQREQGHNLLCMIALSLNHLGRQATPLLQTLTESSGRNQLRFYATLPKGQQPGTTTFSQLTPLQRELITTYMLRQRGFRGKWAPQDPVRGAKSALSEPTLVLPNGIPPDTLVSFNIHKRASVYISDKTGARSVMEAGEFGALLADLENGRAPRLTPGFLDNPIAPAERTWFMFKFVVPEVNESEFTLKADQLTGPPVQTWKSLPAEHTKAIQTLYDIMKKGPGGFLQ